MAIITSSIIENDDDKADTDFYNTLSSDQAKSEYTNDERNMQWEGGGGGGGKRRIRHASTGSKCC